MDTRIAKYSNLRLKIEREIALINAETENDRKLNYYRIAINEVDRDLFFQAELATEKKFVNLNSFIKESITNKSLQKNIEIQAIDQWIEVIDQMLWKRKVKKIQDFVLPLTNEQLLMDTISNWKHLKMNEKKEIFSQMIMLKQKIFEASRNISVDDNFDYSTPKLLKTTHNINHKLIKHRDQFDRLILKRKIKTRWIAFLLIILLICLTAFLIGVFITS